MSDEWGPWESHDGRGCPDRLFGREAQCEFIFEDGSPAGYRIYWITPLIASCESWNGAENLGSGLDGVWDGKTYRMEYVTRFQIRKPRALQELIKLAQDLPEKVDA